MTSGRGEVSAATTTTRRCPTTWRDASWRRLGVRAPSTRGLLRWIVSSVIGLLGCGTVGGGVVTLLAREADDITARTGAKLELTRVAVRDTDPVRGTCPSTTSVYTDDPWSVVEADDVDVVVEVMGGLDPAEAADPPGARARQAGGHGEQGARRARRARALRRRARGRGRPRLRGGGGRRDPDHQAAQGVAGRRPGHPRRRDPQRHHQLHPHPHERGGRDYADVLADAQRLGYAEADPTADVGGHDAAAKCAILASLAFDTAVHGVDVFREGIERVTAADIRVADRLGYVIKLVGIASEVDDRIGVRVHPVFLPKAHPLASVREAFNAVYVEAEAAGELMFYGRGAGALPTASAVVGDVIDVAATCCRPPAARASRPTAPSRSGRWGGADPVLRPARRRRPAPGARRRRPHLRRPRRLDRPGLAGGARRLGSWCSSPTVPAKATCRPPSRRSPPWAGCAASPACCGSRRRSSRRERTRLAGDHRGVPRPDAGHDDTPGGDPARGRDPADRLRAAVRADRLRGAPEVRRLQPDRVLQGPGHDDGDHEGGREGGRSGHLRLDRQHLRRRGRVRRQGRADLRGHHPEGQDRDGQARPGARARRQGDPDRGQLRPGPDPVPRPRRPLPGRARQLGQPLPHRRAAHGCVGDRRPARARPRRARDAGRQRRQHHRLLAGLPRVLGRRARRTPCPVMRGYQAAGAAPIVLGHPVEKPQTIATAIRIGNPASWEQAVEAATRPAARSGR
jgi:homoserine dehydrogenase